MDNRLIDVDSLTGMVFSPLSSVTEAFPSHAIKHGGATRDMVATYECIAPPRV